MKICGRKLIINLCPLSNSGRYNDPAEGLIEKKEVVYLTAHKLLKVIENSLLSEHNAA